MPTEAEVNAAIVESANTFIATREASKDAAAAVAEVRAAHDRLAAALTHLDVAKAPRLDLAQLATVLNAQAAIVKAALL